MIVVPLDYGFWGLLFRSEGHPWPVPRSLRPSLDAPLRAAVAVQIGNPADLSSLALVTPQQPPKPYSGNISRSS